MINNERSFQESPIVKSNYLKIWNLFQNLNTAIWKLDTAESWSKIHNIACNEIEIVFLLRSFSWNKTGNVNVVQSQKLGKVKGKVKVKVLN